MELEMELWHRTINVADNEPRKWNQKMQPGYVTSLGCVGF